MPLIIVNIQCLLLNMNYRQYEIVLFKNEHNEQIPYY